MTRSFDRIPALVAEVECAGQTRPLNSSARIQLVSRIATIRVIVNQKFHLDLSLIARHKMISDEIVNGGGASATKIPQRPRRGTQQISGSGIARSGDCGLSISLSLASTRILLDMSILAPGVSLHCSRGGSYPPVEISTAFSSRLAISGHPGLILGAYRAEYF